MSRLTFSGPLLQQRRATAAQQECALVRRCFTMAHKTRPNKYSLWILVLSLSALSGFLLAVESNRQEFQSVLQHSGQVQQCDDCPSVCPVCAKDRSAAHHWWAATSVGHSIVDFTVDYTLINTPPIMQIWMSWFRDAICYNAAYS